MWHCIANLKKGQNMNLFNLLCCSDFLINVQLFMLNAIWPQLENALRTSEEARLALSVPLWDRHAQNESNIKIRIPGLWKWN